MARLDMTRVATVVAFSAAALCAPDAGAQPRAAAGRQPVFQTASTALAGAISGTVTDELGTALAGAMVSVLGATMAMDVTDAEGRFALDRLPAGEYVLRAHLQGFVASPREIVRVGRAAGASYRRIQLRRANAAAGAAPPADGAGSRPILAAGFGMPATGEGEDATAASAKKDDHPHGETAWRMRHLPRSILKDTSNAVVIAQGDTPVAESYFEGTKSPAGIAASVFDTLPFSGEVNLLTTGAYASGSFLSGDRLPRSIAYVSVGAPVGPGRWSARAAMSQGDLSSWLVGGAFAAKPGTAHQYEFGLSYGMQEYQGGNPLALTMMSGSSRNAGEVFGLDRWTVVPGVLIEYGGAFTHVDYLEEGDFFSPRAGLTLEPSKATRVSAMFTQRMSAPGGEEFLLSGTPGPWLPPERTFAPLAGTDLRVERARALGFALEHDLSGTYVVGLRRFFDSVDDQLVTLFGLDVAGGVRSATHYYVANGGSLDAEGWGVRFASVGGRRVRGAVDYSLTRARWMERDKALPLSAWAPAAVRPDTERFQDITTTVQTDIPETATRVFLLYKVNTAFTRSDLSLLRAGLDGRFDLQVNQALPFGLAGTQWEVLLGLRNLFRDPAQPASIYDEMLVVRPPKRVVGGFLVKF